MATLVVYLELVSGLTTSLFLAALTRFLSRRGKCTDLYSDCSTNFVGAKRYLEEIQSLLASADIRNGKTQNHIQWHLNPPAAPNMAGLWEATEKSAKTLLYRTIKEQILSYEELNTLFHHIEEVLNSRPNQISSSSNNEPSFNICSNISESDGTKNIAQHLSAIKMEHLEANLAPGDLNKNIKIEGKWWLV